MYSKALASASSSLPLRTALASVVVCLAVVPASRMAHAPRAVTHRAPRAARSARDSRSELTLPTPVVADAEVYAGQSVVLTWRSLGDAAEEQELVFSIDDGRHYDVRVSPELRGDECRYRWRVPNIGVHRARVRLRARIGGRERSGPVSAVFRIIPNPLRPPERWSYHEGEWWEDEGGEPFAMPGLMMPPRGPSLRSECGSLDAALTVRAPDADALRRTGTVLSTELPPSHDFEALAAVVPTTFRPMRA